MSDPGATEAADQNTNIQDRAPSGQATDDDVVAADFNAFISSLEMGPIEVVALAGERHAPGPAPQTRFNMTAGCQRNDDVIVWRYDVDAQLTDDDGADFGFVSVAMVLTARSGLPEAPADACIERFGRTSGLLMCYPFLREAIANTALRLGFVGVTLPMIALQPGDDTAAWNAASTAAAATTEPPTD